MSDSCAVPYRNTTQNSAEVRGYRPALGAVVDGYETLHAIHERMIRAAPPGARSTYTVEHVRFPTDDVAIAYVRRTSDSTSGPERPGQPAAFDELALFVLVRRDGSWWLAARQHTPDRWDVHGVDRSPT